MIERLEARDNRAEKPPIRRTKTVTHERTTERQARVRD